MAPSSRTPRANKREADYSNIGVAGRKTGITLKDTGIRDEHGLEPIDGIFSSPEKSPVKQNGTGHESTLTEGEDMDIGESTVPDPTEVLANRKRNGKPLLPPPHARSPMKTALGSSPRRSMGPLSSPLRNAETPSRAMSHPLVNRALNFSAEEPRQSIERSPQRARSVLLSSKLEVKKHKLSRPSGTSRKRPFDLSLTDEDEPDETDTTNIEESRIENGVDMEGETGYVEDDLGVLENGEASLQINGDDIPVALDDTEQDIGNSVEEVEAPLKPKRGRPGRQKKVAPEKLASPTVEILDMGASEDAPVIKRKGRPSKRHSTNIEASQISQAEDDVIKPPKTRGRPKAKPAVFRDEEQEAKAGPEKPSKRARHSIAETALTKTSRKSKKLAPSERDPNLPITTTKGKAKASSAEPVSSSAHLSKPKSRSLYVLRHETPAEDDGSRLLRSGRTSVKPIAYWRGERIVYGESHLDGKNIVPPAIKEVIRTEEVITQRPKRNYRRGYTAMRPRPMDAVEEEDEDEEPWEQEPGILRAEVMQWDPLTQRGVEDFIEDVDLALAPVALEALTREVKGAEFTYAKTLTLPFFHSGMVDLPPGGVKRMKNSRKNHMVFWVFRGRVRVEVAGTEFSIGRGGMWQVPRGNFYSIANQYEKPARVFFAQGCYMEAEPTDSSEEVGGS